MSNIFRSELIMPYAKAGHSVGIGEWTTRNGAAAMDIRPVPFYKNLDDGTVSGILRNEFIPNTSYLVDLWIDVDDVISSGSNVAAGLTLKYTDGTSESFVFTGPKGWNHKKVITPATKSIKLLDIYYYTSVPVYYRWDSYIAPITSSNINKVGQLDICNIIEN
jgi:hypothetical protein